MSWDTQKLLAFPGIFGPPLHSIIALSISLLRPEYDHVTQSMSELGEAGAPYAFMNAGFLLLGLSLVMFAFALDKELSSKIGSALIWLMVPLLWVEIMALQLFRSS